MQYDTIKTGQARFVKLWWQKVLAEWLPGPSLWWLFIRKWNYWPKSTLRYIQDVAQSNSASTGKNKSKIIHLSILRVVSFCEPFQLEKKVLLIISRLFILTLYFFSLHCSLVSRYSCPFLCQKPNSIPSLNLWMPAVVLFFSYDIALAWTALHCYMLYCALDSAQAWLCYVLGCCLFTDASIISSQVWFCLCLREVCQQTSFWLSWSPPRLASRMFYCQQVRCPQLWRSLEPSYCSVLLRHRCKSCETPRNAQQLAYWALVFFQCSSLPHRVEKRLRIPLES